MLSIFYDIFALIEGTKHFTLLLIVEALTILS